MYLSQHHVHKTTELSRRSFAGALVGAFGVATLPKSAFAEVSAGTSLPDGAAQFSRILKSKAEGELRAGVARRGGVRRVK